MRSIRAMQSRPVCPSFLLFASLVLAAGASSAQDSLVISFGVEAGQPTSESIGGLAVEPDHAVDIDQPALLWVDLPPAEDIDAFHFIPPSSVLFSTTTSVILGGVTYSPADVVEFDGVGYSLFFDGGDLVGAGPNIDAFTILANGNLLISTSLSASIHGFSFLNGDVVEVDPVANTASLYEGLDEAALFTGANQDIDALHYDGATDTVLVSVRTSGAGTLAGTAYADADSDLFEVETAGAISSVLAHDGAALFDGFTRQLDAAFVPEPAFGTQLLGGVLAGLGLVRVRRGRVR